MIFLSTYENKIDKKGRISVPAQFRSVIAAEKFTNVGFSGIIAYPSFIHNCVEACGMQRIIRLSESIDALDPYSDSRDAFATSILGSSAQLAFDGEGRITLPEPLIETANLVDTAIFIGKGQTFEIWNPKNFAEYSAKAKAHAKQNRGELSLKSQFKAGE
jgi:MraZ protein